MKKFILCLLLLVFSAPGNSQTANIRGMYVDGFDNILGNIQSEDSLLNYAQSNNFNYLALYNLHVVNANNDLTNLSSSTVLANFIQKAKQFYSISQVGAVGENFNFFNNVINVYNQQHTNPLQKFDVYNIEFEFWNTSSVSPGNYYCNTYLQPASLSCDTAGAFTYYTTLIHQVDSLAQANGVISELYVGWFNNGQAIAMGNSIDRILLHDYISNYSWLYSYVNSRLQDLAARNIITEVIPIFSAEPNFMGPWLATNSLSQPYNDLVSAFNNASGAWKSYINLNGYQYFAYSFMPPSPVGLNIQLEEITENSLYPNPSSGAFTITNKNGSTEKVEIYNTIGESIENGEILQTSDKTIIDLSNQPKGIYFVKITDNNNVLSIQKVVIQ